MPLVYRCSNCGYVFHYLEKVGQDFIGIPSVLEILSKYGYMCPKCKSKLSKPSQEDIIITSYETARRRGMLPVRVGNEYYIVRPHSAIVPGQRSVLPEQRAHS